MMQDSTIDRQNRANLDIVVTKGYCSFFFATSMARSFTDQDAILPYRVGRAAGSPQSGNE